MVSMRYAMLALSLAQLGSAPLAFGCALPSEKLAFDIAWLKSAMMVTALSCNAEQRYNAFVLRFRSELVAEDQALQGYFRRLYGDAGRAEFDRYITSLANEQSEEGIADPAEFCRHTEIVSDLALALGPDGSLATLAAGESGSQPIVLTACNASALSTVSSTK